MSDIFKPVGTNSKSTRNSYLKFVQHFRKTNQGQKALSYIGPGIWNNIPEHLKIIGNINTFKHNIKKHYFAESRKR